MKVFDCECTQPPKIGEPLHTCYYAHTMLQCSRAEWHLYHLFDFQFSIDDDIH